MRISRIRKFTRFTRFTRFTMTAGFALALPISAPIALSSTDSVAIAVPPAGAPSCDRPTGWKRFRCDSRYLGRRVMLRDPGDRKRAAVVALAATAAYAVREPVRDHFRRHRNTSRTRVYERGRNLGKGAAGPLAALSFWLAGKRAGNVEYRETAQIILESNLYATVGNGFGSFILAAERPEDGSSVDIFDVNGHGVSLDVTLAASVVPAIDRRHLRFRPGDGRARKFWKATGRGALYTAVGLTAIQRMDDDKHHLPDVFLGAAIGLATGHSLCAAHEPVEVATRLTPPAPRRSRLIVSGNRLGLAWSF